MRERTFLVKKVCLRTATMEEEKMLLLDPMNKGTKLAEWFLLVLNLLEEV